MYMVINQRNQFSLFDPSLHSVRKEENVNCMKTKVQTSHSLEVSCEKNTIESGYQAHFVI